MKNSLYIISILLLVACQKQVEDFELKNYEPSIVMNGIFQPDRTIRIQVTQSISGLEKDEEKTIPGLRLELFEDGKLITELMHFEENYYGDTLITPEYGKTYEIKAIAPNLENASCILEIPNKPHFTVLDSTLLKEYDVFGIDTSVQRITSFSFEIDDPADEENYYRFSLKVERMEYLWDDEFNWPPLDSMYVNYYEEIISKDNYIEIVADDGYAWTPAYDEDAWGERFYVSDKLFNGRSHKFTVKDIYFQNAKYSLELCSISKDYFDFMSSYSRYTDDPFESFFVEKTSIYSNIQNGLGLIAAMNSNVFILDYTDDMINKPIE